jgi:hypothetical protein
MSQQQLAAASTFTTTCLVAAPPCLSCKLLQRRKKFGLLAAVNNLSNELMLLAVATLFLTALEPAITQICVPSGNSMPPWLANVNGCACCLAKTKGVTACFIEVSCTFV